MSKNAADRLLDHNASDDQPFDLLVPLALVPVAGSGPTPIPTHVITLRGNEGAFVEALQDRIRDDDFAARALRGPVGTISLGHLADVLNSIGGATVQSIDRL